MSMDDNDSISVGSMLDDDGEASGYASDVEGRSTRNKNSSTTDEIISDSDSHDRQRSALDACGMNYSPDISEGEDDESNAFTIAFLQQKRHLLKRAADHMKREGVYDASIARTAINLMSLEDPEIWIEAKRVLRVLALREDGEENILISPQQVLSSTPHLSSSPKMEDPPRKRRKVQKIDVSSVRHVQADAYAAVHLVSSDEDISKKAESLYADGPWMADALRQMEGDYTSAASNSPRKQGASISSKWEIQLDPRVGVCLTSENSEFPPTFINLADALAITEVPQLLAQATHPFSVVHANRAFFSESGLTPGNVFGHGVETVLNAPIIMGASMAATFDGRKASKIQVLPVCSKDGSITTHVLFQLIRDDESMLLQKANALFAKDTHAKGQQGESHPSSLVETCG